MALPALGARVLISNMAATVRYTGAVEGQTGTWVGLEWDDVSHGKHNGRAGGRQYFLCTSGADAGTFVRAGKFAAAADFGVTLTDALRRRQASLSQHLSCVARACHPSASLHAFLPFHALLDHPLTSKYDTATVAGRQITSQ